MATYKHFTYYEYSYEFMSQSQVDGVIFLILQMIDDII